VESRKCISWTSLKTWSDLHPFSLHAARRVRPEQTAKLEELCRYVLRPPLANHRLRWLGDDELLLALKRKWDDGTTHIVLSPSELLARLAALVPPKGFNLTDRKSTRLNSSHT